MRRLFVIAVFCLGICQIWSQGNASAPAVNVSRMEIPRGCSAELRGNRPKIYIANFYVTYGKPDMGKAIGDYIAEKFETDGRLDVISRSMINEEMKPLLREKKLKAERYLEQTLAYAAQREADCVIFGRIARDKKGKRISFLVRMAAVESGQNLRRVDTEVEREEAMGFLEKVGESFVTYFTTVTVPVAPTLEVALPSSKEKRFHVAAASIGLMPLGFVKEGFPYAVGGNGEFAYHGLAKNLFVGVNAEYLQYLRKDNRFESLYGIGSFGFIGYRFWGGISWHMQAVLYGGYQFGKLNGSVESTTYGYGVAMGGLRTVFDVTPRFGILVEGRYVFAMAGSTQIASGAATFGGLWRF